jgi:hypothetical protein
MLKLSGVVNFCRDFSKIENFEIADSDTKNKWVCHHRLETHTSNGELRPKEASLTKEELIALDMYYNRPPEELIFLTREEHAKLHNSSSTRNSRISKANTGHSVSEEQKRKQSKRMKGKKCYKWFNNGIVNKRAEICPEGFVPGRLGVIWKSKKKEEKNV